jgi:hypothetical protein
MVAKLEFGENLIKFGESAFHFEFDQSEQLTREDLRHLGFLCVLLVFTPCFGQRSRF